MMHHAFSRRQFLKAGGAAALSTAAAGLLSSCGGASAGGTATGDGSATYTVLYARQPATLNYLICSADPDLYHGTHCVDTLVEYDSRGKIREGLATSWEWDADTLTWTFHLRDENWVDYTGAVLGPVTAQDFVDALAYLLNPDYASGTASLVTPYVAGAEDYYNYCVWRNNANNGTVAEDGTTYAMPEPFIVLATQNPVDFVGTYPLPEAQLDRFFMRVSIGYPTAEEETDILERYSSGKKPMEELRPICTSSDILRLQQEVEGVHASREVHAYISAIAAASRRSGALQLGVSTRAAISLLRASQARALLEGRDYVAPEDIQRMAEPVLAHRLVLSAEARMRNMTAERVLAGVMQGVQVPVKVK